MENKPIVAIETVYKGCKFRSRLEARWAVFFDAMDIRWEYEPQGYETETGDYLPDFYLPDEDFWVEVKPDRPGAMEELKKAKSFVDKSLRRIIILPNLPKADKEGMYWYTVFSYDSLRRGVDNRKVFFWRYGHDERGHIITDVCISDRSFRYDFFMGNPLRAIQDSEMFCVYGCKVGKYPEFDLEYNSDTDKFDEVWVSCCDTPRYGDAPLDGREIVIEAYNKARQARFEHGETP